MRITHDLRYREFVRKNSVPQAAEGRVLEIGCGVGSSRQLFMGDYTGIDINPDYIAKAKGHLSGQFYVMNAAMLPFAPNSFDDAVCIATAHHLSDAQLAAMVSKAVIVARTLHIIDAILPLSPKLSSNAPCSKWTEGDLCARSISCATSLAAVRELSVMTPSRVRCTTSATFERRASASLRWQIALAGENQPN